MFLTKCDGELQGSDNSTAEGRAANKMRSYNLTIEDMVQLLGRLGSRVGGSVFRLSYYSAVHINVVKGCVN